MSTSTSTSAAAIIENMLSVCHELIADWPTGDHLRGGACGDCAPTDRISLDVSAVEDVDALVSEFTRKLMALCPGLKMSFCTGGDSETESDEDVREFLRDPVVRAYLDDCECDCAFDSSKADVSVCWSSDDTLNVYVWHRNKVHREGELDCLCEACEDQSHGQGMAASYMH
jgi:hypothetical protein